MPDTLPTDAELVTLLRERLTTLEHAVLDYLDVIERTGQERQAAWETYRHREPPGRVKALWEFSAVYERTQPERDAAGQVLQEAMTTDFRTAILTAADITDERRRELLALERSPEEEAQAFRLGGANDKPEPEP